ncbi:MFS transporter [Quadrisphaera sp. GCM10027208]|uniref:MFS transporter n=1 Tax=Quadrisphaera sp. GCM10027208 TaxID=3273423 RepID=UPI00361A77B1
MRRPRRREAALSAGAGRLTLRRDGLTWTLYGWLGTWGWFVFGFSPAVPLLRAEQGTSRSVAALHGTMLALGAVLAGWFGVALTRRFGRRAVISGGALTLALGVLLLVSGGGLEVTLPGALLAGTGGSTALNATSPALADHHGPAGAAAISEANAGAALVGVLAPLALGASVAAGLGWRPAVGVAAALGVAAFLAVRRLPPDPALDRPGPAPDRPDQALDRSGPPAPPAGTPRLGLRFWSLVGVLALGVGVEFSTTFWAGDLLQVRLGAAPGTAAAAVTGFVAGMAVGRLLAGRLALRFSPARLLLAGLLTAGAGWLVLWTAPTVPAAVVGLVVAGGGVALLFPLSVSLVMAASGGRPDLGSAAGSVGAGVAIGSAPFALGALADAVGPHQGFLLVPVLLLSAAALLLTAVGAGRRARV